MARTSTRRAPMPAALSALGRMNDQAIENFMERGRILKSQHIEHLSDEYREMIFEQSRKGMRGSGATIDLTMKLIVSESKLLYSNILDYVSESLFKPSKNLESQISNIADQVHINFYQEALPYLQKSVDETRRSDLFDRMRPNLESKLGENKDDFENRLNLIVRKITNNSERDATQIVLWVFEFSLLATAIFIAGRWYQDPDGNHEPLFVLLVTLAALIGLVIRWRKIGT